jgi:hypothetical protein
VIPRTIAINEVEGRLENTLVAVVGGSRLATTTSQVTNIAQTFDLAHYKFRSFLILLPDRGTADHVLHGDPPREVALLLRYNRWRCQVGAVFSPVRHKVLLSIENMLVHVWSREVPQTIIGTSCLIFNTSPHTANMTDMSIFLAAAWAVHPDLIPVEVACIMLEPVSQLKIGVLPLFLHEEELIHDWQDTLQFRTLIKIIEVQDQTLTTLA